MNDTQRMWDRFPTTGVEGRCHKAIWQTQCYPEGIEGQQCLPEIEIVKDFLKHESRIKTIRVGKCIQMERLELPLAKL